MIDSDVLNRVRDRYRAGLERNRTWRTNARRNRRFFCGAGDQWEPEDRLKLEREGRPALTLNRVKPVVRALSGSQRQNRQDFKVFPRRGGNRAVAEVLTALLKHAMDVNHGDWMISQWALQGMIDGKSWLGLDVDYTQDPENGDIAFAVEDGLNVFEDREASEYDVNRGSFIVLKRWRPRQELELRYGKEAIGAGPWRMDEEDEDADPYRATDDYEGSNRAGIDGRDDVTWPRFRVPVLETYWKEMAKIAYLVDRETMEFWRVKGPGKAWAKRQAAASGERLGYVERIGEVLHVATTCGEAVLEHIEDPFNGLTVFPWVRFCAEWVTDPDGGGNISGVIDPLIDPQREHNKRRSQVLHHLNQSANSGWMYEAGSLFPGTEDELVGMGSRPGMRIVFNQGRQPPVRIQPAALSQGHMELADASEKDIKDISGVNSDLLGHKADRQESGVAMDYRRQAGMTVNEPLFDNLEWSQQMFGTMLCQFIRAGRGDRKSLLYTNREIAEIVEEKALKVDLEAVRSFRLGRYGVRVSQSPNSPTLRMANFRMLAELAGKGIPIPPKYLLKASDHPEADEIIAEMEAAAAAAGGGLPPGGPAGPERRGGMGSRGAMGGTMR